MPKCVNVEGSNGEEAIMNTEDANLQKFDTRAVSLAESTSKLKTAEPTTETALRMSEWAEKRSSADTHLLERMREVSPFAIDKGSYQLAVQLEELEELKMRNLELTESVNNLTREKEVLAEVFRIGQEHLHDANQTLAEAAAAKDAVIAFQKTENLQLQECITEMQRLLEAGADRLLYAQDANQALVETAAATDIATTRQAAEILKQKERITEMERLIEVGADRLHFFAEQRDASLALLRQVIAEGKQIEAARQRLWALLMDEKNELTKEYEFALCEVMFKGDLRQILELVREIEREHALAEAKQGESECEDARPSSPQVTARALSAQTDETVQHAPDAVDGDCDGIADEKNTEADRDGIAEDKELNTAQTLVICLEDLQSKEKADKVCLEEKEPLETELALRTSSAPSPRGEKQDLQLEALELESLEKELVVLEREQQLRLMKRDTDEIIVRPDRTTDEDGDGEDASTRHHVFELEDIEDEDEAVIPAPRTPPSLGAPPPNQTLHELQTLVMADSSF